MTLKNKLSIYAVLISIILIVVIRINVVNKNELSWDVFGYYISLPATFIQHDPLLKNTDWIYQIQDKYQTTDTLYQISHAPNGSPIYFFLFGMAYLYLPFFLIGHFIAIIGGYPVDGFSLPYQYSLAFGAIIYTIIGLIFLRKILLKYFNDTITALVIVILVFGTNYTHFATYKNLETSNFLFMLIAALTWQTIKWHQVQKQKYLVIISIVMALTVLVKPSEVFCILIPLLWGVSDRASLGTKIRLIKENRKQIYVAIAVGLLFVIPQILYWLIKTGRPFYDSYINPGIGLDIWSPHILNILFSFRKGWLIYTPVMLFALAGFILVYKKKRELFYASFFYFLVSFYIIASWTEWWYGASFSIRPLITVYPILAIPFGFTIKWIAEKKLFLKSIISSVIVFLVALNLFQWWQMTHYILDPYRTTRAYYFAVFGKTKSTKEDKKLLLLKRSFSGTNVFNNKEDYSHRIYQVMDFENQDTDHSGHIVFDSIRQSHVFHLPEGTEFSPDIRIAYRDITTADHAWLRISVDIFLPEGYKGNSPFLVTTFNRKEGNYKYRTVHLPADSVKHNTWISLSKEYLTPNIRSSKDKFQTYVWNNSKQSMYIDNLEIEIFEPLKK